MKWCDATVENKNSYINDKLGIIEAFYRWALETGQIDMLPFEINKKRTNRAKGMLQHTSGAGGQEETTSLRLPEYQAQTKVLSLSQVDALLTQAQNPTHRRMIYLGLNAGLRAEEIITFPAKYVIDCGKRTHGSVKIWMDTRDMDIKFDKSRMAHISVACMNSLWQYRQFVRPSLQKLSQVPSEALFLTRTGVPFVSDGLVAPLTRLGKKLGFHAHPHMLRHTFASHTLEALEMQKLAGKLKGSPIVILQGMLGHDSIFNTIRYGDLELAINDVHGTFYQSEIDSMVLGYLKENQRTHG